MIKQETIQGVFDALDIVDVVSEFVKLKKRGANHVGLSPFVNEKTPSFVVSPAKGIFKDFSSGKGGNAINFLMEHEHWTYPETIKWLAERYKIQYLEDVTPERFDELQKLESIYKVNEFALSFFQENLPKYENATKYVANRALNEESIKEFQIGYAPDQWDELTKAATENHFSKGILITADLSFEKKKSHFENDNITSAIDKFRNRLMFPIHTLAGKIAGFTGRVLPGGDKELAKYINTSDTDAFKKSSLLFGMHIAKKFIKQGEGCFLTEGQIDVVSLHQHGFKNTVATSGTALTREQIRIIKRFTTNLTFLYDGDSAGFKAAARGLELAIEEGMRVRVVIFPEGEDPDSFVNNYGADEFKSYIEANKLDVVDFYFRDFDKLSPEDKDDAKRLILGVIAKIPNHETFRIKEYVRKLADKYKIPYKSISDYLQKVNAGSTPDWLNEKTEPKVIVDNPEKEFARLLIKYGDQIYFSDIYIYYHMFEQCFVDDIQDPLLVAVKDLYYSADHILCVDDFLKCSDPMVSEFATHISFEDYAISENWTGYAKIIDTSYIEEVKRGIANFRLYIFTNKLKQNIEAIRMATDDGEIQNRLAINKKIEKLQKAEADKLGISILAC